ncbi:hypothetical protein QF028_004391 [Neobacillus sp. B4I6]
MPKKVYVKEWTEKTVDKEELQVCVVNESMIKKLSYIVFIEK